MNAALLCPARAWPTISPRHRAELRGICHHRPLALYIRKDQSGKLHELGALAMPHEAPTMKDYCISCSGEHFQHKASPPSGSLLPDYTDLKRGEAMAGALWSSVLQGPTPALPPQKAVAHFLLTTDTSSHPQWFARWTGLSSDVLLLSPHALLSPCTSTSNNHNSTMLPPGWDSEPAPAKPPRILDSVQSHKAEATKSEVQKSSRLSRWW